MIIQRQDVPGRWWRIGSWEVDLRAEAGTYPPNVRACALAVRDAADDEGRDVAALLAVQVEAGETFPLAVVSQWLFTQAQAIAAQARRRWR